ncbi:hypothetical protein AXF42_Ash001351 [Apostasia shenzhenica]|uniref:Non-specific serine/threonine protein kinase n=1 Tax=Apostasia shenzhenica TaxID=1088818 RepID=A0A2I0AUN9_9ASPA|nr:hypothetical protein AXF42_Ash001351 [Apostasia shenzhenica]
MAVASVTAASALLLLFANCAIAGHTSPESSPSPSPVAGDGSTQVPVGAIRISAPPSSSSSSSPLADPSPGPTAAGEPTPSPALAPGGDLIRAEANRDLPSSVTEQEISSDIENGGMNGGKKAAVAIGVAVGAALVGIGAVVYKKRQVNIRRARYGFNR